MGPNNFLGIRLNPGPLSHKCAGLVVRLSSPELDSRAWPACRPHVLLEALSLTLSPEIMYHMFWPKWPDRLPNIPPHTGDESCHKKTPAIGYFHDSMIPPES